MYLFKLVVENYLWNEDIYFIKTLYAVSGISTNFWFVDTCTVDPRLSEHRLSKHPDYPNSIFWVLRH